jgi:hypothetical protein
LSLHELSDVVVVPGGHFVWTAVLATAGSSTEEGSIKISGHGEVSSLKQDGREVLPSRAADFLTADPAHRGIYGGIALFVVATWGVLFKRSFDILAKRVLPD